MRAKERHKCKLLEYLGNPDNEFPSRVYMNDVILGFKGKCYIYKAFTLDELNEIEVEALDIRRKKYNPGLARADKGYPINMSPDQSKLQARCEQFQIGCLFFGY